MAKALSHWKVSPHGPLTQLEPNLWWVEQPMASNPLHRVMTVARRDDGVLTDEEFVAGKARLIQA